MKIKTKDISINNRLEIEYMDEDNSFKIYRCIVFAIKKNSIEVVTEAGNRKEFLNEKIIYAKKNNFDKEVSKELTRLKNHYMDVFKLEEELKRMQEIESSIKKDLFKAKVISRMTFDKLPIFLTNELKLKSKEFKIKDYQLKLEFYSQNKEILVKIIAFNKVDDEIFFKEDSRSIKNYAPNITSMIEKKFPMFREVIELKRDVEKKNGKHIGVTIYEAIIDIDKQSFNKRKKELIKILETIEV